MMAGRNYLIASGDWAATAFLESPLIQGSYSCETHSFYFTFRLTLFLTPFCQCAPSPFTTTSMNPTSTIPITRKRPSPRWSSSTRINRTQSQSGTASSKRRSRLISGTSAPSGWAEFRGPFGCGSPQQSTTTRACSSRQLGSWRWASCVGGLAKCRTGACLLKATFSALTRFDLFFRCFLQN